MNFVSHYIRPSLSPDGLFYFIMYSLNEIWKDVPGYEGLYQSSNLGRIKSLGNDKSKKEKILKQYLKRGYYRLILWNNKRIKSYYVHQVIAITFLNHVPNGNNIVVDHINNDKNDNRLINLQLIHNSLNIKKKIIVKKANCTSKYLGVNWNGKDKRWMSRISINGKQKYLGGFLTENEANEARINALNNLKNNCIV